MATLLSVHGSFAHWDDGSKRDGKSVADDLWWKAGSTFEKKITECVTSAGADGQTAPLNVERFLWSGNNSEIERRAAGLRLLEHMLTLEARGEPYCVVGHSHGGSVIAAAMLAASVRRAPLSNMRRWITVGTPFIGMRPLPRLIDRLNLIQRVLLVASLMLLMMYLVYTAAQYLVGASSEAATIINPLLPYKNLLAAVMMSVPAILMSVVFYFFDRRHLFYYRRSTIARARDTYGARWLPFCHANDEALQGLRSIPHAKIALFDPGFAVQRLTLLAVVALPVAYLSILWSPTAMVGIANVLKNKVYQVDKYAAVAKTFDQERKQIRGTFENAQRTRTASPPAADAKIGEVKRMRTDLKQRFPEHVAISRALRFQHDFLEVSGAPCPGGNLCGGGRDVAVNSKLLFHIVTDDLTSALINDDTRFGVYSEVFYNVLRALIPMVLVPVVFASLALLFMVLLGLVARVASAVLARILNRMTFTEIKRELYGNDTSGEVATGVEPRPAWLQSGRPFLPAGIAGRLTNQADQAASISIAKFRNALSAIALSSAGESADSAVSNYLSWRELIHSAYFDLPEFQLLIARALTANPGFAATAAFKADLLYGETGTWLQAVDVVPATAPGTKTMAKAA